MKTFGKLKRREVNDKDERNVNDADSRSRCAVEGTKLFRVIKGMKKEEEYEEEEASGIPMLAIFVKHRIRKSWLNIQQYKARGDEEKEVVQWKVLFIL